MSESAVDLSIKTYTDKIIKIRRDTVNSCPQITDEVFRSFFSMDMRRMTAYLYPVVKHAGRRRRHSNSLDNEVKYDA